MGHASSRPSAAPHAGDASLTTAAPLADLHASPSRSNRMSVRETVSNALSRSLSTRRRQSSTSSVPVPTTPRAQSSSDHDAVQAALWCFVKAKTRMHNSNKITRKSAWFESKPGAQLTIGRKEGCDLILDDDRCAAVNARLVPGGQGEVVLVADARMYRLIGMGMKPKNMAVPMQIGTVIKVGSVSLEVTAMCTDDGENFVQRFVGELKPKPHSVHGQRENESRQTESNEDEGEDEDDEHPAPAVEDDETPVCYICWGGADDPVAAEELNAVRKRGERRSAADKRAQGGAGVAVEKNPNPLIRNPCGKCSGSSRYVHLQCMLTWIRSSGSGHCSICNGTLPQHFSSPPPNLELKVVRHRRGQSWTGTRRFRISFSDKQIALIGRDSESDVRLSDRSVCATHAQITFDKDTKQFFIQDHASLSGTFILLTGQLELPADEPTYVKIGRTTLSMRISSRRTSLIRGLLPSMVR
jgi:hypothetical protein